MLTMRGGKQPYEKQDALQSAAARNQTIGFSNSGPDKMFLQQGCRFCFKEAWVGN